MLKKISQVILSSCLLHPAIGIASSTPSDDVVISDGQPILLDKTEISINPPFGWEVLKGELGKALILQEPRPKKIVYGKELYQRNLTVAVSHEPTPIDEKTVTELKTKIQEAFTRYGSDFRLSDDAERFDFKKTGDGVLLYSYLTIKGIEMTQAHVFVSGSKQSLLMTYTDLSSRFHKDEAMFATIWNTMTTVDLEGVAPGRFDEYIVPGIGAGVFILFMMFLALLRKFMGARAYRVDADFAEDDDFVASENQTGVMSFGSDLDFIGDGSPSTQTSGFASY